jgi:hypothetical protein
LRLGSEKRSSARLSVFLSRSQDILRATVWTENRMTPRSAFLVSHLSNLLST